MNLNYSRFRPLSLAKRLVWPSQGRRPRKVYVGLFKNLILNLDLRHQTQVYFGLWERETHDYVRRITSRCDWMIDVGAGNGELCLYFLKTSQASQIIAVDPLISEIDILQSNLTHNGEQTGPRLKILKMHVGTAPDPDSLPLDSLTVNRNKRGFVKIDAEGAEYDILESGNRLLSGSAVDLLVETHSRTLEVRCLEWLQQRGYCCKVIKNAWWRTIVPEQRPLVHNRWIWATNAVRATI